MKAVVGLIFDETLQHVLLVLRLRQPYAEFWNGCGGRIEEGESPLEAMVRETSEETSLDIESWEKVCDIPGHDHNGVRIFATTYPGDLEDAVVSDQAKSALDSVAWFPVEELPEQIPPDIPQLIQRSLGILCNSIQPKKLQAGQ